jgi:hypothetical protein
MFVPGRWGTDRERRRAAGIPAGLERKTKPQLAEDQPEHLPKAGLPARWAAFDEAYGRSSALRRGCEAAGLAYVALIPRDFLITVPSGTVIRAEAAVTDAVFANWPGFDEADPARRQPDQARLAAEVPDPASAHVCA